MNSRQRARTLAAVPTVLIGAILASCSHIQTDSGHSRGEVGFETDIKPLLEFNCLQCHNSRINHGNLILESRRLAFRPRPGGPVIVPGKPDESLVYSVIRFPDELANAMPPTRHRLENEQIGLLRRWIKDGAGWPEGEAGELSPPEEKYPYPPVNHPALRPQERAP